MSPVYTSRRWPFIPQRLRKVAFLKRNLQEEQAQNLRASGIELAKDLSWFDFESFTTPCNDPVQSDQFSVACTFKSYANALSLYDTTFLSSSMQHCINS